MLECIVGSFNSSKLNQVRLQFVEVIPLKKIFAAID